MTLLFLSARAVTIETAARHSAQTFHVFCMMLLRSIEIQGHRLVRQENYSAKRKTGLLVETQILNSPAGVAQVPLICAPVTPVSLAARIVTTEAAVKNSARTILKRIPRVVLAMEIGAAIEVMDCANVLGEEKVQCPVKCHTNLFV